MIRQERLDELKRCDTSHKFFDEFSYEVNSIVKQHRKGFEDKAHSFIEKYLRFLAVIENWLKEQKSTLQPSIFEQYLKQLSGTNNFASPMRFSILEQCQRQLSNILEQGVNKNNHLVLSLECRVLKQCQEQLYDTLRQVGDSNFVLMPELGIIEQCIRDIRQQYQRADWKEIKILHSEQIRKGEYSDSRLTLFVPPDFPDDPASWLNIYHPYWYDPKASTVHNEFTCSPEDELLRSYIALVILFNKQAVERGESLISPDIQHYIDIPSWTFLNDDYNKHWLKIRNVLIGDLEAVDKDLASTKPAETERKDTPTTIININKLGVLGDIQKVETLQTGDNASAHKQVVGEEKKKRILRRIPYWIYLLVSFLAALFAILHYMGWLAPNK